jgi:hypothetical protein
MAGLIRRTIKHRRTGRTNNQASSPQPTAPILITSAAKNGTDLVLIFDQVVVLSGTPGITTNLAGVTPVSAAKSSPNVVTITYSAAITTATSINLPFRDPAIRNASGGFVTSSVFPLAA